MSKSALKRIYSENHFETTVRGYLASLKGTVAGVDGQTPEKFARQGRANALALNSRVIEGTYRSSPLLGVPIIKPSGGVRVICVPTVADRVVQKVLHEWLVGNESRVGKWLQANEVAFGIGRGRKSGANHARTKALQYRKELPVVYKVDINKFFDEIDREILKSAFRKSVRTPSLYCLIDMFIDSEVGRWSIGTGASPTNAGIVRGRGLRQGMPLSPILAAIYLKDFDEVLSNIGFPAIRYVDDIVIFLPDASHAELVDAKVRNALERFGLRIPDLGQPKCQIYQASEPAEFLGMHITADDRDRYTLSIPDSVLARAESRFEEVSTVDGALQKGVTFARCAERMDSIKRGYTTAYLGASNLDAFVEYLDELSSSAMNSLLEDIFGIEFLRRLNRKKKRFLGLE